MKKGMTEKEFLNKLEDYSKNKYGNISKTVDDIEKDFIKYTQFDDVDMRFLFIGIVLQCIRIYIIEKITSVEKAGNSNKREKQLHEFQKKTFKKLGFFDSGKDDLYYASLNHIVLTKGVPYDATKMISSNTIKQLRDKGIDLIFEPVDYITENKKMFRGANHRFSTLGHDPYLGLIFGTANIMTNTISTNNKTIIKTNHVLYTNEYKDPHIGSLASTAYMFYSVSDRIKQDDGIKVLVAAIIKQLIHIETDLFTPVGIPLPMLSVLKDKKAVEEITKYISYGSIKKFEFSIGFCELINYIISIWHQLMFDESKHGNRDLYTVKTNNIIKYSNMVATGSNVINSAIKGTIGVCTGNGEIVAESVKSLDVAGIIICIQKIAKDRKFQQQIKNEFYLNQWKNHMEGREYV